MGDKEGRKETKDERRQIAEEKEMRRYMQNWRDREGEDSK